jgi:phytoene desaturase
MNSTVVIIGAGIAGLSAAIRLVSPQRRVIVLEQNPTVGGKMGEIRQDGFRWDTGPSVITMRPVLEDLFASVNRRLDDYLTLLPIEPLTRYFYPDGVVLDASSDVNRMTEQIRKLDERDVKGYKAYLDYAAQLYNITAPSFIYGQPPSLRSFTQFSPADLFRIDGLRTMDGAIKSFVKSPHLRQLLGRFATYVGASPYRAPATLNVIAHVELSQGVWYPKGGIYRIAQSLFNLAEDLGVDIRPETRVEQINVTGKKVTGVTLSDGKIIDADAVITNVDVATVYERLLPQGAVRPGKVAELVNQETSCSGFILLLGVEGKHPALAHHNIFFSADYRHEFDDIFERGLPPDDPTIYVAITSKTDPDHAPENGENWFVLVNVPALNSNFDWVENAQAYRDRIMNKLSKFGLDIRVRTERMLTPVDLERLTGARRGALYGISSNHRFAAFLRPNNRAKEVNGLYFAGGTTHPGGGVPMVMQSGKVVSEMIASDGF